MITLRCSSAPRWVRCGLSPHLAIHPDALPDTDTDAAREGTCAAWVAEKVINGEAHLHEMLDQRHKNGWVVDADMIRHLTPYCEMAMSRGYFSAENYVQHDVTDNLRIAGTADLWSTEDGKFCIDDLKYGFGIVEPDSPQLLAYLAVLIASGHKFPTYRLGIYQPRAMHPLGPYRTIEYTYEQAVDVKDSIVTAARAVADAVGTPGSHCRYCAGAHLCTALGQTVYSMWDVIESRATMTPDAQQLSDEKAMLERMSDMLTARGAAVDAEIEQRINQGQFIPGWARMPRYGKRKFRLDGDSIEALTGIDPWNRSLCTPAELERRGGPSIKPIVQVLSETPIVGYKLEKTDPRQIERMFKK